MLRPSMARTSEGIEEQEDLPRPEYSDEALTAHATATTRRDTLVTQLKTIKETKLAKLEALALQTTTTPR